MRWAVQSGSQSIEAGPCSSPTMSGIAFGGLPRLPAHSTRQRSRSAVWVSCDGLQQRLDIHRFDEMLAEACSLRSLAILFLAIPGQRDEEAVGGLRQATQGAGDLV